MNKAMHSMIAAAVFFAILLLLSPTVGAQEVSSFLTPANIAKLEAGEVVMQDQTYTDDEGKVRGKGLAIIMVNTDSDTIFKYLGDFNSYAKFMPRLTSSKTYKSGAQTGVEYELKITLIKVKYSCLHEVNKSAGTLKFWLDKSKENDIVSTDGLWTVVPHGQGKAILAYTVSVDSGMAIPKVIQDYLTKKDLPKLVTAAKKRIESGGAYTK